MRVGASEERRCCEGCLPHSKIGHGRRDQGEAHRERSSVILADYRGLTVKEMQALRAKLREAGGEVKVYKNTLTEIALRELALPDDGRAARGPDRVHVRGDGPGRAGQGARGLRQGPQAARGEGRLHRAAASSTPTSVKALASLPSREELVAKLLGTMQNPIAQPHARAERPGRRVRASAARPSPTRRRPRRRPYDRMTTCARARPRCGREKKENDRDG